MDYKFPIFLIQLYRYSGNQIPASVFLVWKHEGPWALQREDEDAALAPGASPWKQLSPNSRIRGTEHVGGDEGNGKAKPGDELFSSLLSQNCCRNLGSNRHKLLIVSVRVHVDFN